MADRSGIEWTDATWSPVTGCTRVSDGCLRCYIERTPPFRMERRRFDAPGVGGTTGVRLHPERLDVPLHWRKPRRVFVCSLADLFHDDVSDEYIARVWAVMAVTPQHTYQVLTKRHARMRSLLSSDRFCSLVAYAMVRDQGCPLRNDDMPLRNVWLGVSVEDQDRADLRIPALLDTPAAVRFLSCEPLLGPIRLWGSDRSPAPSTRIDGPDWVIVGGESGPGARPMHPDWARSLRDQCTAAGVPFLFKQWGEYVPVPVVDDERFVGGRAFDSPKGGRTAAAIRYRSERNYRPMRAGDRNGRGVMLDDDTIAVRVGKGAAGRDLDGRTWDEYPQSRVRPSREDTAACVPNQGVDRG